MMTRIVVVCALQRTAGLLLAMLLMAGCSGGQDEETEAPAAKQQAEQPAPPPLKLGTPPADRPGLHRVMQLTDAIYSGSEPHGEEAFEELAKMGVKTIVSVDGAKPNAEAAKAHGMQYVHIPIGYDGIPEESGKALARVAQEAEGPIYFHCHHGKHRGPAAAAAACIAAGSADRSSAEKILEQAGTSPDYPGLWRDVREYQPPQAGVPLPELVEYADVGSLAAAMAKIDRASDNLKLCQAAEWSVPEKHPDVQPVHEAVLLREGLTEAGRNLSEDFNQAFRTAMQASAAQAELLEKALKAGQRAEATALFEAMQQNCKACHQEHRN